MRRSLIFILFVAVLPAMCKQKPKQAPVYDQVGTYSYISFHADYTAHYNAANGSSYDYYCDSTSTSITCTEGIPGTFAIIQPSGARIAIDLVQPDAYNSRIGGNPLLDMNAADHKQINFRFATQLILGKIPGSLMVCVPYDIRDKHGKVRRQDEACYIATRLDGK